ncbi:MAG TPA: nuclear transport factor 2 family protein [Xanthobacteraceae bacterium]|nr:nuclear transport factor 2 family protein [Xanthobacteraceae bacterium]
MPLELPPPIASYFRADTSGDADALAQRFTEDAIVTDEGQTHRGPTAIRDWWQSAKEKYHHTIEPLRSAEQHGRLVVTSRVSGNFPGSPVELDFVFEMAGDKIRHLEVR